ncbi:phage regulatory CII family protein [Stenotrophomonas sp. SORGH_AS_0321]|uniref:phage regulatory CII family protein n=1 Tax=Stenotrophomonas sp. SORGH_AS_0321 TaxID=3041787 RepID=UPI002856B24D|nr:phage regulatory CII family protein [Stenotrophomonas sp. SORGH_AS_0321]MDR6094063.1 hypothetical protein [Stenotrophomonas sp. SORGH_AS_0321]
MNAADAAHKTVHAYPSGSESLSPRIGMSAAVQRNKVNPNNTTHHLTLAEGSEVMGVTGDDSILHAMASQHGYALSRTEVPESGSLIGSLLAASGAKGDLAEVIADAIQDCRITPERGCGYRAPLHDAAGHSRPVFPARICRRSEVRAMSAQLARNTDFSGSHVAADRIVRRRAGLRLPGETARVVRVTRPDRVAR